MLFHSWHFAIFFIIVYSIYLPLRSTRFYLYWLLLASYFFYGWWNPLYLLILAYSTITNYLLILLIQKNSRKKLCLVINIVNNLLLLGSFKYGVFATENLNMLLSFLKVSFTVPVPGKMFPLGISFYTFQAISYAIEIYRGKIEEKENFLKFAAFLAFFPRLVAGPIERGQNLIPQFARKPEISINNITEGVSLFVVGIFKKVALADYLAMYVDKVYASPESVDSLSLIFATFAFTWQIYFDFSGYTDMARGLARMMGFNLTNNFNNPYLATGLGDFWNRWHISLSSWFKDYLYIPLGGNRKGNFNTYKNIFITMVVSGLWHGADWTFVIWGALHAIGRFMTRELERAKFYNEKVPKLIKQVFVFIFVSFAWIFFRAETFEHAVLIVKGIFTNGIGNPNFPILGLCFCLLTWIYQFAFESRIKKALYWAPLRIAIVCLMILYLITLSGSGNEGFIYIQF